MKKIVVLMLALMGFCFFWFGVDGEMYVVSRFYGVVVMIASAISWYCIKRNEEEENK